MISGMQSMPQKWNPNWAENRLRLSSPIIQKTVRWYLENPYWVADITTGAYRDWMKGTTIHEFFFSEKMGKWAGNCTAPWRAWARSRLVTVKAQTWMISRDSEM
jgi:hypothetical protein